jgi:sugar (pentulose or hexulose) kinase
MSGPEAGGARLYLGTDSRLELTRPDGGERTVSVPGTGGVLRWFTDHLTDSDQSIAVVEGATVFEIIDEKASGIPPGCEGLHCIHAADGTVTLTGLTSDHGRYHVYRAILEGGAFALRSGLETAGVSPADLDGVRVEGPGARSRLWQQIHADILEVGVTGERLARPDAARRPGYRAAYRRYRVLRDALSGADGVGGADAGA